MTRPTLVPPRHADKSFAAALALTSLSTLVAMLAYSGPLGNATAITEALAATPASTTWILSSMSAGLAVALLSVGALADMSGRRRVFGWGAWVFAAGSVVSATATTSMQFVLGRLVEGVGAAGLIATGLGLVSAVTGEAKQRSIAASWWGGCLGLGIAIGPLLTGAFDLVELWRAPYWLFVAFGVAMALAAPRCFPETATNPGKRLDPLGVTLMTVGLGLLLVALVEGRQGAVIIAASCAVGAVVALAAFVVVQLRSRSPMLEFALFRRGDFVAAVLAATATGAGVIALMSFACTFLVTSMGLSTLEASATLALWSGTSAVCAVLSRRLATRVSGTAQLVIGLTGTGAGLLLLAGLETGSGIAHLVPGLLLAGVASGVLNAGLGRQSTATVPADRAAVGLGVNNTARYVAASVGVTLVGLLAAVPGDPIAGWNQVAILTGAVSLAGAAAVLVSSRSTRETR